MARNFQQQARRRKLIYAVLILVLFTVSLLHRRLVVEPEASSLLLRQVDRGEVELAGSAVRLLLTGSRGLATTFLWSTALDMQEKHEWTELELVVDSITQLQPYFTTPWLYQSWNLAFNVAVEFDLPRDKYFYVSRGLHVLAKGERMHQGFSEAALGDPRKPRFPGNPEMRHFMGFYYQLKIGHSDEKNVMRCLLDLSCIDPLRRDPNRLLKAGSRRVDLEKLARLTRDHPRLVRRLQDKLGYDNPREIVDFLQANRDVPSRFKTEDLGPEALESPLLDWRQQFPILPYPVDKSWPNPLDPSLTSESIDVFLMSRTWFSYAQTDLPPPTRNLGDDPQYDRLKHRLPKSMATMVFRSYPARAQAYIAENLEAEGWFDGSGWTVRDWFALDPDLPLRQITVGTEGIYHAAPAWDRAYRMYREYGLLNGLYYPPAEFAALQEKAKLYRDFAGASQGMLPKLPSDLHRGALGDSYDAHTQLHWNAVYRNMVNFDDFLFQSEAERMPTTVAARKLFFDAQRLQARRTDPELAIELYERAFPLWLDSLFRHPRFAAISTVQEETYEWQTNYLLRLIQKERSAELTRILLGMPQLAGARHLPLYDLLPRAERDRILPIRTIQGFLETLQVPDGFPEGLAEGLFVLSFAPGRYLPIPHPTQPDAVLVRSAPRIELPLRNWKHLLEEFNTRTVRERLGLPTVEPKQ